MSACSNSSAAMQLSMKVLGTGFSNPSQEATLAEHHVNMSDIPSMEDVLDAKVLLTSSVRTMLLSGVFVATQVWNPEVKTMHSMQTARRRPMLLV